MWLVKVAWRGMYLRMKPGKNQTHSLSCHWPKHSSYHNRFHRRDPWTILWSEENKVENKVENKHLHTTNARATILTNSQFLVTLGTFDTRLVPRFLQNQCLFSKIDSFLTTGAVGHLENRSAQEKPQAGNIMTQSRHEIEKDSEKRTKGREREREKENTKKNK